MKRGIILVAMLLVAALAGNSAAAEADLKKELDLLKQRVQQLVCFRQACVRDFFCGEGECSDGVI